MEEWRNIQGYEGLYQISNKGRVKSLNYKRTKKEKILKGINNGKGYLLVGLYKDGKPVMKLVHRLVAQAFLENPQNLPEVNHRDENPTNNNVDNLEWCDAKYNMNYGTCQKRSHEKQLNYPTMSKIVDQIDAKTGEVVHQWASTQECDRNGYTSSCVSRCARGKQKTYKGYVWKYLQA